jgi:hypothetical protein
MVLSGGRSRINFDEDALDVSTIKPPSGVGKRLVTGSAVVNSHSPLGVDR